ncbi:MAG: PhoH family protein, partial [Gemmatirosa sp.]|nr:PhoH family protein [Gemmatirosa sp.]
MTLSAPTPDALARTVDLAQRLIELARQGGAITPDDVLRLSLDAGREGGEGGTGGEGRIALPGVRKVIQAKTSGQAEYMKKIAEHDIVIGIGPAGTGKTYLAVAMAV